MKEKYRSMIFKGTENLVDLGVDGRILKCSLQR